MNCRSPNNIAGRLGELEKRFRHSGGGRFYLIWGRDEADCADKLRAAKLNGDLHVGDRYDTKIWPHSIAPPEPRLTALHQVSDEELNTITLIHSMERQESHLEPLPSSSVTCQYSDAELSEIYAEGLPTVGPSVVRAPPVAANTEEWQQRYAPKEPTIR